MTEHDLTTLVREHVTHDEPAFLLSPETAMALGRRTLRRRRARRGAVGIIAAAAAVALGMAVVPHAPGHRGDRTGIDPATAAALAHYDARKMPGLVEDHVGKVLARAGAELGAATFTASDSQGEPLPTRYYDKASSMEVTYGGSTDHRFRAVLMHARPETEGDARMNCADDLKDGYDFSCTVTTTDSGYPVITRVMAVRPLSGVTGAGWSALTRTELRTGIPAKGDPIQGPIDPDEVYFRRTVEAVHSESFLTAASEIVRAPDLETAGRLWAVPVADLTTIVTDPELVIPEPPLGTGGCPWTWHSRVTCGTSTG